MNITEKTDLWDYLRRTGKPVVLYGMGNGADKIIDVCNTYGIKISDVFASDGFVRGHSFHGMKVLDYSHTREKYGDGNFIILLSFATYLDDVTENIKKISAENELYAPDVPVSGNTLFNYEFYNENRTKFERVYDLLSDDISKKAYEDIINYKLSGKIGYLFDCEHTRKDMFDLMSAECFGSYADIGAYNGDTVRELKDYSPNLRKAFAFEPDSRTFKKLSAYAESENGFIVNTYNIAAWSYKTELNFDSSANRNSNISNTNRSVTINADTVDSVVDGEKIDYIKYDVEGSENEAIEGSKKTISKDYPVLSVSIYHRSEDLFSLPLKIKDMFPYYDIYIRRGKYIPAWDINLIAIKK